MKKIIYFAGRKDEQEFIDKYAKEFELNVSVVKEDLSPETVEMAKGYDGVIVITSATVNKYVLNQLKSYGIDYISSRSIGYNSIDIVEAKKLGMKVSNSTYSPYSVSEYTILYSIMLLRNLPKIFRKMEKRDFSLKDVRGKELRNQIVGVIGAGKIGKATIEGFLGMGVKEIYVFDRHKDGFLDKRVQYVELDELLQKSDIITIHLPLNDENYHFINGEKIEKMKENVIILNTARGELIDTNAIIDALEKNRIGGVALDVLEGENGHYYSDNSKNEKIFENYEKLRKFENIFLTPHTSFFTAEAVHDMVYTAMFNMKMFLEGKEAPNNIIK